MAGTFLASKCNSLPSEGREADSRGSTLVRQTNQAYPRFGR